MFNIFKKKKLINTKVYDLLNAVAESLAENYPFLKDQANKDFILDIKQSENNEKGAFNTIYNSDLKYKFINKKMPHFFIITGIRIWNNTENIYKLMEIDIVDGIWVGFNLIGEISDYNIQKIDINQITEKHFNNEDKDELIKVIGKVDDTINDLLDIDDTFKIEIEEGEFYTIKDIGDGNYISMDKKGAVYSMIHDPYKVLKLYNDKEIFFEALKSGDFDISNYPEN